MNANTSDSSLKNNSEAKLIIEIEKKVVKAFKNKDGVAFTKNFAKDYTGIANDGIKTADGEIEGMQKLDLSGITVADEKVMFPAKDVAIITYKMIVNGKLQNRDISASIYSSSVYIKRQNEWLTVLHTESMAK